MKKIKAIFTGKNGSMGFESNQEYELILQSGYGRCGIWIYNNNGTQWCPYGSFIAFLNNWNVIRVIN